jgi:hypothetical protein
MEQNHQAPTGADLDHLVTSIAKVIEAINRLNTMLDGTPLAINSIGTNGHPSPQTRRRIHRNTSVKGIVTYESTVETFTGTLEETIAEQQAKLQPQYEEWVTALPSDGP